jgi:hypothetical protein
MKTITKLAQFLKVPLNSEGFFLEAHMKLRPVDFMTDGVFLCGLAHSPKSIEESILQAQAASARAAAVLSQDSLELEGEYLASGGRELRRLRLLRGHLSLQSDHHGRIHVAGIDQESRRRPTTPPARAVAAARLRVQRTAYSSGIYPRSNRGPDPGCFGVE